MIGVEILKASRLMRASATESEQDHFPLFRIRLTREPEGGYTAIVPALPGCVTFGQSIDEAIAMAHEAIELYIESIEAHGEPVPDGLFADEAEIDRIVIAEADDDGAWEAPISKVMPPSEATSA